MARRGAVATDVKENDPMVDGAEKEVEETMDVPKKTSGKGKKPAVKKGDSLKRPKITEAPEEEVVDENLESSSKEEEEAAAEDKTEEESAEVPAAKLKRGAKKAEEVKEEKMPPKKGRKAAEKKEEAGDVAVAETEEENTVAEEPVAKGKAATKGRKAKKEEAKEEEEQKVEEEEKMESDEDDKEEVKKAAPKGRGAKKATAKPAEKEDAEMKEDEEEEVAAAPKKGRKAAAPKEEEEGPETKKQKKEDEKKPAAAKGRGKKAAEKEEDKEEAKEDEEEKEEVKDEVKPKGRGRQAGKKAAPAKAEKEEDKEEEEKPAGRPKRGAATKSAAAAKKIAEDEEKEEEDTRPKRGAKAKKTVEKNDDEDGPTASKKPKIEKKDEEEEEDVMSTGKSMTKSIRRTVQVKGAAAVDSLCTRKMDKAHVYAAGDLIYDVMLNQTNIGNNNNKFYVIQLLEDDDQNHYSVWNRWGRVGYDGQSKLTECGPDLNKAIREFSSKFEAKTKNQWPTAFADFQTYAGKYTMIEMDYGADAAEGGEDAVKIEEQEEEEKKCKVECQLDARVQQLMHLMCSIRQMQQAVKQLEFDADKSPLGKLTQQQIKEGFACLGKIEKFIEKKDFGADFKMAVNEYYTKVPHACGFRPPALIRTPQLLKQEIELLDLLQGIEYAIKTMKQETKEKDVHPVDRHYASLKCDLAPMEAEEEEYKLVAEYLAKTHASTHSIQMGLKNVFRVGREGEAENEEYMDKIGNRKLLWHGSRLSNYFGILSQGLRIAPPEAPATGYMFGKGVYFADMATKSGNYCYVSEDGQTGFLLLAEVALGEEHLLKNADYNANNLPAGKSSTWGLGRTMPDPSQNKQLNEKVVVPCGKPIANSMANDAGLLYNEFIVYNTQQIRLRYLLEIQFNFI